MPPFMLSSLSASQKIRRISGLALMSLCFTAPLWGATGTSPQPEKPIEKAQTASQRSLAGSYLSGRFARSQGDVGRASQYAMESLAGDPDNAELLNHAFRLQLSSGHLKEATELATRLQKLPNPDTTVNLVMALSEIQKKDYAAAAKLLDVQEAEGFNAVIIPLMTAWLDHGQKKLTQPVVMNEVAEGAGNFAPFVYYHLALVNDAAGFTEAAEADYQRAFKKTEQVPYRVAEAFANFYERNGQPEKAKTLIEGYRIANPESFLLEGAVRHEVMQSAPKETKSENGAPRALVATTEEGIAEIFFAIASLLYNEDAAADTMAYTHMALALRPNFPPAQLMLGSLYEQAGDSAHAMAMYNSIDPASPLATKAKLRIALNMDRMNQSPLALRQLDALAKENPKNYDVWLTRGDILRNRERFAEATAAYSEAVERLGPVQKQHWPIFFVRGIAYERAGDWTKAEADLKKALELEPNQPDVLNYLGYSLLTQARDVEQAKAMIEQAIEARPADAQIIDSMGWALYSLGEYDDAQDYLERAVELLPSDPTVNDHLGDLYWRLERRTEARYQWERSLIFEKDAKIIAAIHKKLDAGLPAVEANPKTAIGARETPAPETAHP